MRAGRIAATWAEQRHIREVMAALQGYGISTSLAVRIYKKFGDDSGRVITQEPYRLAREVWGIGFKTADKIAQAVGIARDAPERLQAGVLHALGQAADEGHTLLPEAELVAAGGGAARGRARTPIDAALDGLARRPATLVGGHAGRGDEPRLLALAPFARAESGLASRLQALQARSDATRVGVDLRGHRLGRRASAGWPTRHGLTLAPEQEAGGAHGADLPRVDPDRRPRHRQDPHPAGDPDAGQAKRLRCLLAAPTGRAAKRMEEATGLPGGDAPSRAGAAPRRARRGRGRRHTRWTPTWSSWTRSACSMPCSPTSSSRPSRRGTHLLLVGDPDQLPSVGAGDVLADLLRSERFPVTRLTHIFRQGAGSGIAANARRINAGELPRFGGEITRLLLPAGRGPGRGGQIGGRPRRPAVARAGTASSPARSRCSRRCTAARPGSGASTRASRSGSTRRDGLPEARGGGRVYRPGDRVLQLKNDYGLEVFNGDLGHGAGDRPDRAGDDARPRRRAGDPLPVRQPVPLTHAYAISVHKAQGAEFPAVVIPLLTSHAAMLGRTLLYTAVTRAQRLVVIVGQQRALAMAVKDWRRAARYTALDRLLTGALRYTWPSNHVSLPEDEHMPMLPEAWEGLLGEGAA